MFKIIRMLCICTLCACAGAVDIAELTSEIRQLRSVVSSLIINNQRMEMEIKQLQQKQSQLEDKLASQDTENFALKERLDGLTQDTRLHEKETKRFVISDSGPHVAFTVYLDHPVHNMTSNQAIVYNQVLLNQGSGYDEKTGIFTAPYSGIYLFSYSVGAKAVPDVLRSQYDIFTKLVIDGDHQISAVAESMGTYDDEQSSNTAVLYVSEASQVWTAHQVRGGTSLYSTDEERMATFTGVLLYTV